MKSIINSAIGLVLLFFPFTPSSAAPDSYNGLDGGTWWKCEKDAYISRVWGLDYVRKGNLMYVESAPWTASGTFNVGLFAWDGKLPLFEEWRIDPGKKNIKQIQTWIPGVKYSWCYERTGFLSRWQGCPYYRFSKWVLNDRRYWTFVGTNQTVW